MAAPMHIIGTIRGESDGRLHHSIMVSKPNYAKKKLVFQFHNSEPICGLHDNNFKQGSILCIKVSDE